MAMSATEKEIVKATGVHRAADETDQAYFRRQVEALQEIESDKWDALSKGATDWANAGAQSIIDGGEIAPFPDAAKKAKKASHSPEEDAPEEAPPKKKKKEAAPKSEKGNGKSGRAPGAQVEIKKMIIKKPDVSVEAIVAGLQKKGLKATPSSVSSIRAGTLQTMRLVRDIGLPEGF